LIAHNLNLSRSNKALSRHKHIAIRRIDMSAKGDLRLSFRGRFLDFI